MRLWQVSRLDTNERRHGFTTQYAHHYRIAEASAGGVDMRDLYTAKGVRILISTRGEGKKVPRRALSHAEPPIDAPPMFCKRLPRPFLLPGVH